MHFLSHCIEGAYDHYDLLLVRFNLDHLAKAVSDYSKVLPSCPYHMLSQHLNGGVCCTSPRAEYLSM